MTRIGMVCLESVVIRRGLPGEWSAYCTRDAGHTGQHVALADHGREILRWPPDRIGGTTSGVTTPAGGDVMDDDNAGHVSRARAAILAIEAAGNEYAEAVELERGLEHLRPRKKAEAIARLMATENPETHRQHSASSAEKIVESDPDFWQFCQDQRLAAAATIRARARYEAARATAHLELSLVQASTQVLVHSGA